MNAHEFRPEHPLHRPSDDRQLDLQRNLLTQEQEMDSQIEVGARFEQQVAFDFAPQVRDVDRGPFSLNEVARKLDRTTKRESWVSSSFSVGVAPASHLLLPLTVSDAPLSVQWLSIKQVWGEVSVVLLEPGLDFGSFALRQTRDQGVYVIDRSFLSPATGSLMIKVVPCPTTLSTSITPL